MIDLQIIQQWLQLVNKISQSGVICGPFTLKFKYLFGIKNLQEENREVGPYFLDQKFLYLEFYFALKEVL